LALPVSITAINSFSPLGNTINDVWQNYLNNNSLIDNARIGNILVPAAKLPAKLQTEVNALRSSEAKYTHLDDSVLYAILASRAAVKSAGWKADEIFGINIGSSRGATQLFEKHHQEFISTGATGSHSSPSTTLGNISSWVAQDLKSPGPEISHSITCSTSLHAVLNGIAWIGAGMADKFLVGGSEASLTPFTVAQMKAMKIYSSLEGDYPSRALDLGKTSNSMVLGEGAASACLEPGRKANALAVIEGIGYSTEILHSSASISANADCMQKAMKMALKDTNPEDVDAIVMHAPGTIKGDRSEFNAVNDIFDGQLPLLTTNKWKIGHTFGAAGILSLELAVLMLQHNKFIPVPFIKEETVRRTEIKKILVNAVGFGGNAVSLLVARP
jgi:3-oxoacyl-(acyl-carrier-protein) synthase